MDSKFLRLELRYIVEKTRNRLQLSRSLAKSTWQPKLIDLPPGERFLVLAPHPDDEAIGCGGTIAKLVAAGKETRVVFLSSSPENPSIKKRREAEAMESMRLLGVKNSRICDLDFTSQARMEKEIEGELSSYAPDTVFLPSPIENLDDHVFVTESYLKVMAGSENKPLSAFYEVWSPLLPNAVVDITATFELKMKALAAHTSQMERFGYQRAIRGLCEYRAGLSGISGYAEAFQIVDRSDLAKML